MSEIPFEDDTEFFEQIEALTLRSKIENKEISISNLSSNKLKLLKKYFPELLKSE
jgi:hypothetical protein